MPHHSWLTCPSIYAALPFCFYATSTEEDMEGELEYFSNWNPISPCDIDPCGAADHDFILAFVGFDYCSLDHRYRWLIPVGPSVGCQLLPGRPSMIQKWGRAHQNLRQLAQAADDLACAALFNARSLANKTSLLSKHVFAALSLPALQDRLLLPSGALPCTLLKVWTHIYIWKNWLRLFITLAQRSWTPLLLKNRLRQKENQIPG